MRFSDDYYNEDAPSYSEANKEAFNLNDFDKITWVRNGDAAELTGGAHGQHHHRQ